LCDIWNDEWRQRCRGCYAWRPGCAPKEPKPIAEKAPPEPKAKPTWHERKQKELDRASRLAEEWAVASVHAAKKMHKWMREERRLAKLLVAGPRPKAAPRPPKVRAIKVNRKAGAQ
jgi:hypothetical protein